MKAEAWAAPNSGSGPSASVPDGGGCLRFLVSWRRGRVVPGDSRQHETSSAWLPIRGDGGPSGSARFVRAAHGGGERRTCGWILHDAARERASFVGARDRAVVHLASGRGGLDLLRPGAGFVRMWFAWAVPAAAESASAASERLSFENMSVSWFGPGSDRRAHQSRRLRPRYSPSNPAQPTLSAPLLAQPLRPTGAASGCTRPKAAAAPAEGTSS